MYTHPKVDEALVVGIPNARLGEIVVAWVRLRPNIAATEEEIREFCKGQIAYYKIPEHIRFVDTFPATLSGKIQKYKMREFEIEARGLQDVADTQPARRLLSRAAKLRVPQVSLLRPGAPLSLQVRTR